MVDTDQLSVATTLTLTFSAYYLYSDKATTIKSMTIKIELYSCLDLVIAP